MPLAGVRQPELVTSTIETTIGVHDLTELRDRQALLVVDNFEHLLDAAPVVATLLSSAPQTKVLTTSRAPLRVEGEREYPVEPLPDDEAVILLTERARALRPEFVPDDAARQICRRLDGLPLALELAASRLRSLDSNALLERLDRRLPLLTSGRRDAPERQRTLRATIEWSYDLLDPELQRLFARLGVFATFTLAAAEAVAGADLDRVDALVEASLVKPLAGDRFLMLETIREFAFERLAQNGEEEKVRLAHAEFFAAVAESANLHTESEGPMRHDLVRPELNNVRAALEWTIASHRQNLGLHLAVELENFWVTADPAEAARWIETLLSLAPDPDPELHAMALQCLGNSATVVGDPAGERFYEQSLAKWRALGHDGAIASVLHRLAVWAAQHGDDARARSLLEESAAVNRRAGLGKVDASILLLLGDLERRRGAVEQALPYYEASLARARETGFTWWEKNVLLAIARTLFSLGRADEAARRAREALEVARRMGDRPGLIDSLVLVARGCGETGDVEAAGRLWGAIEAEVDRAPVPGWDAEHERLAAPVLAHDGPAFDSARAAGRALALDDAVAAALRS